MKWHENYFIFLDWSVWGNVQRPFVKMKSGTSDKDTRTNTTSLIVVNEFLKAEGVFFQHVNFKLVYGGKISPQTLERKAILY